VLPARRNPHASQKSSLAPGTVLKIDKQSLNIASMTLRHLLSSDDWRGQFVFQTRLAANFELMCVPPATQSITCRLEIRGTSTVAFVRQVKRLTHLGEAVHEGFGARILNARIPSWMRSLCFIQRRSPLIRSESLTVYPTEIRRCIRIFWEGVKSSSATLSSLADIGCDRGINVKRLSGS